MFKSNFSKIENCMSADLNFVDVSFVDVKQRLLCLIYRDLQWFRMYRTYCFWNIYICSSRKNLLNKVIDELFSLLLEIGTILYKSSNCLIQIRTTIITIPGRIIINWGNCYKTAQSSWSKGSTFTFSVNII